MMLTMHFEDWEMKLLHREAIQTGKIVEALLEELIQTYLRTLPGLWQDAEQSEERRRLFQMAKERSLKENAELYRRLAKT